jgi:hypothetical protein
MKKIIILVTSFIVTTVFLFGQNIKESTLWGTNGMNWDPKGRLPDYSYAGYQFYEKAIPNVPQVATLASTAAKPDDGQDDSDALQDLINAQTTTAANPGAILIPKGRWEISKPIVIAKPGLVLRGEVDNNGNPISELYFPIPHPTNRRAYWIQVNGTLPATTLGTIESDVSLGDNTIPIKYDATAAKLKVGDMVQFIQFDDALRTLSKYLHGDREAVGDSSTAFYPDVNYIYARIVNVNNNTVTIDRHLPNDLKTKWKVRVSLFEPNKGMAEVGFEKLAITCNNPNVFKHGVAVTAEPGFRMIEFNKGVNCWARNLVFNDMDEGIKLDDESCFITISDIVFQDKLKSLSYPSWDSKSANGYIYDCEQKAGAGHHPILIWHSYNCVVENVDFKKVYWHELSVEGASAFNVFHDIKGIAVSFDNHAWMPYSNLWTNIDLGRQERLWFNSGEPQRSPKSGWRNTYWNIMYKYLETREPVAGAETDGFTFFNLIGYPRGRVTKATQIAEISGVDEKVAQPDLFLAQFAKRRALVPVEDVDAKDILIYPNPNSSQYYHISKKSKWEMYNINGQLMENGNSDLINIASYNNGLYLIRIEKQIYKVVISR